MKLRNPIFRVKLSDALVESMTLAAVEAYVLGVGKKGKVSGFETMGYIWGYRKKTDNVIVLYLDRMSLSVSAKKSSNSVKPNEYAAELKNNIVQQLSPQLMLLGDFHTHPYYDLEECKSCRGWEFSDHDKRFFLGDDFLWEAADSTPINIVIAVCRLGRVQEKVGATIISECVWQYDVGEFRFWINVNVGYMHPMDGRVTTEEKGEGVFLDFDARFYNGAGNRVASHVD